MELPKREVPPGRAAGEDGAGPGRPRTPGKRPEGVDGRFDRELRRASREQTSLLSWLAEADETSPLRDDDDEADPEADPAIDLRRELSLDELIELVPDESDGLGGKPVVR